nr:hypothetical protein [Chloroflexia bacterium]
GVAAAAEWRGAGQAFLSAGGAVILATIGALAGGLDDRTGALLIATVATVGALSILLWGYLYRSRHPMPPRPRPRRHALRDPDVAPGTGLASAGSGAESLLATGAVLAAPSAELWFEDSDVAAMPAPGDLDTLHADAAPFVDAAPAVMEIEGETITGPEPAFVPEFRDSEPVETDDIDDADTDLDIVAEVDAEVDADSGVEVDSDVAGSPPIVAVVAPGAAASAPWSSLADDDDEGSGKR